MIVRYLLTPIAGDYQKTLGCMVRRAEALTSSLLYLWSERCEVTESEAKETKIYNSRDSPNY